MIMFDYGHTLLAEVGFDTLRGTKALMRHVTANPLNLSAEQVNSFNEKLYGELAEKTKTGNIEICQVAFQRLAYEYQRLEFSLTDQEIEQVWWDGAAPGAYLPHVREMLKFLRDNGYRSGVISNTSYSGGAMRHRIESFFPEHKFEFIMTSCDYVLRKPSRMLFETALRKADLPARDVWFCGDSVIADIPGAAAAGIFPVWYEDLTLKNDFAPHERIVPVQEHLHVWDWSEFVRVLGGLE
jgi:putative hydrolase of the HAD superfamily